MSNPSAFADEQEFRLPDLGDDLDTLNVLFDGRRVWSLSPSDYRPDRKGVRHVGWPAKIRDRLDGTVFVEVRHNRTDVNVAEGEFTFGSGGGRVEIADSEGRPLVLNKWGTFTQPFDSTPREVVEGYLDQVEEVLAVLRDDCGLDAFISFGTLLGAVRGGGLIGHDVDVDLGYLSRYHHPVDVVRELLRVEHVIRGRGWRLIRQNGGFLALFMPQSDGSVRNLDIFSAFIADGTLYQVHDIGTPASLSDVLPLTTVSFEGRQLPAPAKPEVFLEAAYGPGWRVPDPGFSFSTPRATKRRILGWLGGLRLERDRWRRYYELPSTKPRPEASDFARWVHDREPGLDVLELGSGLGEDAGFFAEAGHAVIALDFVAGVVPVARRGMAGEARRRVKFIVRNLYSMQETLLLGARLARDGRERLVYIRGLFDDLRPDGRDLTWRLCSMALRGGGHSYIEAAADRHTEQGEPVLVTPDELVREAALHGASLRSQQQHVDRSSMIGARRHLSRIVLEW